MWPQLNANLVLPAGRCVYEEVWECLYCTRTLVEFHLYAEDHEEGSGLNPDFVTRQWPPQTPRELDQAAPEAVRSLYAEASLAENAEAYRGAAALYRAAVEELCTAQGINNGKLFDRIEKLVEKKVDRAIVDDLHEARLLGNWSLHEGVVFDAAEVADVAELIAEAVVVIYVQPAQRQAMREARRARREGETNSST